MKTNPYVAIHCPKALSLSIVCQPIKIKFIKGRLSILHLKFSAFTTYLVLKVPAASSQVESSMLSSKSSAYFAKQKTFKAWLFNEHYTCKVSCTFSSWNLLIDSAVYDIPRSWFRIPISPIIRQNSKSSQATSNRTVRISCCKKTYFQNLMTLSL